MRFAALVTSGVSSADGVQEALNMGSFGGINDGGLLAGIGVGVGGLVMSGI